MNATEFLDDLFSDIFLLGYCVIYTDIVPSRTCCHCVLWHLTMLQWCVWVSSIHITVTSWDATMHNADMSDVKMQCCL